MAILRTSLDGAGMLLADALKQKIEASLREQLHDAVEKAKEVVLADLEPILTAFTADLMVRLEMIREIDRDRVVLYVRVYGAEK